MDRVNEFEYGVDERLDTKQRFSDEATLHYRYPTNERIEEDLETIMEFVIHHMNHQAPRLKELNRYYEGLNTTILRKARRKEEHLADHRAVHNFAEYISTFIQGYIAGVPIKTEYPEDEDRGEERESTNDLLQRINRMNEADEHNSELVLDQSIYGRAYELVYRRADDTIRFVRLNPEQTFVIYSDDIEREPIASIRYQKSFGDENTLKIYLYTPDQVYEYEYDIQKKDAIRLIDETEHYFQDVPIVEYENNSSRRGDFEAVLNLIDMYDSAQSDLANYSQDLNDAMLKIRGYVKMDTQNAQEMKKHNILLLKPAVAPDGSVGQADADYIYKQYDVAGMEAYKTRIANDIFLLSSVPNLLDSQFSGTQSGEALKMKLFGLSQKRATKERKFKRSLRNRYRLIKQIMDVASEGQFDVEKLQITFTENIPRAISQELEWFSKLGGKLSEATMLSLLSFVENPKEEQAKIAEEQQAPQETQMDFEKIKTFINGADEEGAVDAENGAE